ncbi:MAG: adenylate kinase [uncultured DHVE6 group euryarchaeote]|jgi:adenylate kinase|nr:MAG: adenylate kinase [uncultured DHVE6 group euryarchaeote]
MQKAIIVVGPPGAGKGTQAKLIAKKFGYKHISTGDILRGLNRNTELGKKLLSLINKGNFVPPKLAVQITLNHIKANKKVLVLDGFPRNVIQAKLIKNKIEVIKVIAFTGRNSVFKERLIKRGQGRADDTVEVINHRFKVYKTETEPLLKHYGAQIVHKINAEPSIKAIFKEVEKVI